MIGGESERWANDREKKHGQEKERRGNSPSACFKVMLQKRNKPLTWGLQQHVAAKRIATMTRPSDSIPRRTAVLDLRALM